MENIWKLIFFHVKIGYEKCEHRQVTVILVLYLESNTVAIRERMNKHLGLQRLWWEALTFLPARSPLFLSHLKGKSQERTKLTWGSCTGMLVIVRFSPLFHYYLRGQRANIDLTPSKRPTPSGLSRGRSPTRAGCFEFCLIPFSKTCGRLLVHLKTEEIHFPFQILHLFCLHL